MEDYKKKYKDVLAKAREIHRNEDEKRFDIEWLFPELKESEDEQIRKALIRFHKSTIDIDGIKGADILAWLEKQGTPQDKGEISDGYHTFNELYYYRMLYNAAFFNMLPKEWVHKSKRHNDGEECFGGGWFIVMANLPTGQISNHYELKDWDLFQIPEKEVADKWDGHTPQEAADRLHKYLLEKQSEQKPFDHEHATITQKDFASVGETATIELSSPIDCGDRIYHVSHKPIEKQGEQKPVIDFKAKNWYVSKVDGKIHDMTYNPANKIESKVGEKIEDEIEVPFGAKDSELQEVTYYIPKGFHAEIEADKVVIKKGEKSATWSDEDKNKMKKVMHILSLDGRISNEELKSLFDWLKSLKDRIGG